jgi:putative membrane protein
MTEGSASSDPGVDASRRTWLALERTWLAWWRTGIAAIALALAVGRFLPRLTGGPRWPFRVLGIGYGVLAIAVLVISTLRQRYAAAALRRGGFEELPWSLVLGLSAAAVVLGIATLVLIAADL